MTPDARQSGGTQDERQICLEKGLFCSVRRGASVLRFVPPFATTTSQLDAAAETLGRAIQEVRIQR
jgi:4-aminobutyrate aminotransferase-like enzyme